MKNFKKILLLIIIPSSSMFLSGCDSILSWIGEIMCQIAPNSDHCFQWSAVQGGDESICEKIKGTKFKNFGSNPPKDKCYMQIAENTGNESICDKIKGGMMSYTKEECQGQTRTKIVKNIDKELKEIDSKIEDSIGFTETEVLVKKKKELEEKLTETFKKLPDSEKSAYYKTKKDEILSGITDEDLKQQIAHSYAKERKHYNQDTLEELKLLKRITQIESTAKNLDENANMLVDSVKSTLVSMVNEQIDETKNAILDDAKEKVLKEVYKRSGDNMKVAISKLEKLKGAYDKSSEYYNSVNEKYEKIKAAYDKMKDIQGKLDTIEKLGKEGKLDIGKVKVLKGSILLGEGLEYVTSYVPVFGSTISTISKETFGVVNKFATKRAIRTTSINKCIEDPLNCDTDNISGY